MIAARAVQLKVLQTFATPRNPDFQKVEEEVRALKTELSRLEGAEGKGPDPLMPDRGCARSAPSTSGSSRDLKYAETLYEQLAKQYELARIDEARDAAVIQVIDPAIPPERKVKPKRRLIVLASTFLGFAFGVTYVLFSERKRREDVSIRGHEVDHGNDTNRHAVREYFPGLSRIAAMLSKSGL